MCKTPGKIDLLDMGMIDAIVLEIIERKGLLRLPHKATPHTFKGHQYP